ncbi:translation initiation factor eIF2B subunit beta-like [Babylonia areolata]|uniref:translation initiation factor eIF2B subunit beta-like n=1 Tax=Babylonia areolata TaxID=304850 RepID=UPI003FD33357
MPGEVDRKEAVDRMEELIVDLKKGKEVGSYELVKRTIDVLRRIIAHTKWTSAQDLLNLVREEGKKIIKADPSEGCIANMVRRVLRIVREEFGTIGDEGKKDQISSADNGDSVTERVAACDFTQPCPMLKGAVIESIGELLTEIDGCVENIASQALEHIHADETIMTFGHSKTVEAFLKNAARKRKFHVIVSEGEPFFQGHHLAKNLADLDINVTIIPDTHVYAMMRKVNKVIIGTHSIMAEGGCKVPCGIYNVAQAAKDHKVPLFVCTATYKLCPEQFRSETQPGFQKWADPNLFLPIDDSEMAEIEISTVVFEYVRPELISLFIFNTGTNAPSHVYRLLKDIYHQDDLDLEE